ncbi:outer membrane protein [Flavobacterium cauense R2A-7]|uniref:TonB-linked SusC/RagA family outer membrane protein n=1 Tax=Flavobacterium cauense R2A-7 TaxID=1341154 RepID=V6RZT3_9FLAO|nr:SusC/RagA family TonB-linked outer membrane protein [Flavobacterium cauense]ESU19537.1 outer membrane protein [Flavobacterium cauense R2A-7]TWI14589.1 TonB-linked SusC/RagA family outer membrane protein [Flavobacterium cauense R2A-7]
MRSKFKWIFTLLLAFSMQFSFAQEKTVTGTVTEGGLPLPGVSVVVKGTTRGTQTDMDGNYSIKAKTGEVLVFSFIGMKDSSAAVGASNKINVAMAAESTTLENVVVTALGIKKRQDEITSSTQLVKSKELTQAANPNVVQSLAGKVAGLQINTTNNGVNATTRIVLRGNRSITGDNQALVVIDNVISTAAVLQSLSPDIVESTNILKGAQGAALYGDAGVNGVILVTTKKGAKSGKLNVSVNSSVDFESVSFIAERQRRYGQGWNGQQISYENGGWGAEFDGVVRPVGLAQADGSYIMAPYSSIKDNIKKFFNDGTILQNGLSISGGSLDDGYALLSVNNQKTDFVVKGDELNRSTFSFKGGKKFGKWTVEGNTVYVSEKTETTSSNLFTELLQTATNIPVERFEHSGNEGHWTAYYNNPYWLRDNVRNTNRSDYFSGIATLNYALNKNINFNYVASIQVRQNNSRSHTNGYIDNLQVGGGNHTIVSSFDTFNQNQRNFYGDFMINFDYMLTDNISFKANIGNNMRDNYTQFTSVGGDNLTIPGLYNISNVTGEVRRDNGYSRQRRFAFFANVDLGYKDFLSLNLTGRNDWNSTMSQTPKDNYFYPSAGISFTPTKINGLKDSKVVNYTKLYANYIVVGNSSAVGVYGTNDTYLSGTGYPFGGLNSFTNTQTPTDINIKPEFMSTFEVGAALGFFKDRITLEGSYYNTKTDDLITRRSVSAASGITSVLTNVGQMTTTGFEIELGFAPIRNDKFSWENRIAYSHSKSVVDKAAPDAKSIALVNFSGNGIGIFADEGEEFPLIKGIAYERDDQGRVIIDPSTGNPVRSSEYKILGKATPDYIINYNTSVEYKGIRLAAVMDYRTGHQFWAGTKDWLSWSGHLVESAENGRTGFIFPNSATDLDGDGVYEANTTVVTGGNTYTSYLNYFSNEYRAVSENMVLDATAFKVRELSLSYSLPSKMIEKAGLSSLRFGVNARNPFTVLPKENRGYHDPEQSRSSGNDQGLAVTGQYPATRTFGFNVNLTF